jgi:opacity protein-like surface antigen
MKTQNIVLTVSALAASIFVGSANAQQQPMQPTSYTYEPPSDVGFRLNVDAGLNFMQDFTSGRLGFDGRYRAWPGTRVDAAPEFDFFNSGPVTLGVDFESGVLYNPLHHVLDDGESTYADGRYWQVPFVGDLILRINPPNSYVTPYIGAGGGGDWSHLRIDSSGFFGSPMDDDRVDPAVHAIAGVMFHLNSMMQIGVTYKMLGALSGGNHDTFSHAALATFTVKF